MRNFFRRLVPPPRATLPPLTMAWPPMSKLASMRDDGRAVLSSFDGSRESRGSGADHNDIGLLFLMRQLGLCFCLVPAKTAQRGRADTDPRRLYKISRR